MKAAVLEQINSPLSIREVGLTPLQVGQVLVKVLVSGLCGAQLQEIAGLKGNANFLPHLLGHEGCGIVEEIGLGVTNVKVGDKVVMHWRKGDGIEAPFPKYILDGKTISSGKVTSLSEYSIVSENRLTRVPHDTSDNLCALLGCGLTTALGVINNEACVKFGESVMIVGCGGVGLNLIQGARLASAYPIIGADIAEDKREKVNILQGDAFINLKNDDIKEVLEKLNIKKVDVIIDTTGNVESISNTMKYLADSGRYILVGQPKPTQDLTIQNANELFLGNGKMIKATQGGKTSPNEDIPRYVKLHKAGLLNIDNIISHTFELNEINEAIELLKSGKAGRIMIKM
jgi:S-(hydroxymethyl)glutathione dehydrogenase/alcohol dehydrogenase